MVIRNRNGQTARHNAPKHYCLSLDLTLVVVTPFCTGLRWRLYFSVRKVHNDIDLFRDSVEGFRILEPNHPHPVKSPMFSPPSHVRSPSPPALCHVRPFPALQPSHLTSQLTSLWYVLCFFWRWTIIITNICHPVKSHMHVSSSNVKLPSDSTMSSLRFNLRLLRDFEGAIPKDSVYKVTFTID